MFMYVIKKSRPFCNYIGVKKSIKRHKYRFFTDFVFRFRNCWRFRMFWFHNQFRLNPRYDWYRSYGQRASAFRILPIVVCLLFTEFGVLHSFPMVVVLVG
jgi:hypothetical protein